MFSWKEKSLLLCSGKLKTRKAFQAQGIAFVTAGRWKGGGLTGKWMTWCPWRARQIGRKKVHHKEDLKSLLGCSAWFGEWGDIWSFGTREREMRWSNEALVQSQLREKGQKTGKLKMTYEHQARDPASPELGQARGEGGQESASWASENLGLCPKKKKSQC